VNSLFKTFAISLLNRMFINPLSDICTANMFALTI
jgi:hypothetical protein